jgi:hypothetical protein
MNGGHLIKVLTNMASFCGALATPATVLTEPDREGTVIWLALAFC